jgi:hypothetical protein
MCDSMCVIGPAGTMFAKNSDRPFGEVQLLEALRSRPAGVTVDTQYLTIPDVGARAMVAGRPDWLWGIEMGVNDAGVAIGNEKLLTARDADAQEPALIGMDLVRLCLERTGDADEALATLADLLATHGQGGVADRARGIGYFSSFLITDPHRGWVVETCGSSWWAAPVSGRAAISNRISLPAAEVTHRSDDLADDFDPQALLHPDAVLARADRRLACTLPALDQAASPADLVAVLRHHGTRPWGRPRVDGPVEPPPPSFDEVTAEGISVCMHLRRDVATTAAMVAELPADGGPVRAWVASGSPCVSVFVPVFPPHGVPTGLGRPELWERFAALRDRVEGDGNALAEIRSVTGPLESELWAEADDLAPADRSRFTTSVDARLDAALSTLGV